MSSSRHTRAGFARATHASLAAAAAAALAAALGLAGAGSASAAPATPIGDATQLTSLFATGGAGVLTGNILVTSGLSLGAGVTVTLDLGSWGLTVQGPDGAPGADGGTGLIVPPGSSLTLTASPASGGVLITGGSGGSGIAGSTGGDGGAGALIGGSYTGDNVPFRATGGDGGAGSPGQTGSAGTAGISPGATGGGGGLGSAGRNGGDGGDGIVVPGRIGGLGSDLTGVGGAGGDGGVGGTGGHGGSGAALGGTGGTGGAGGSGGAAGSGRAGMSVSGVIFDPDDGGATADFVVRAATVGDALGAVPGSWPERTGYTFLGWQTVPGGAGPVGSDAASGQRFAAQWEAIVTQGPGAGPALADTGADITGPVAAGLLVVLLGALFLAARGRRAANIGSRPGGDRTAG